MDAAGQSAMWIGREGLMAALRDIDESGDYTALTDELRAHLKLRKLRDEIKRIVYQNDFGAKGFAALAPVVSEAAVGRPVHHPGNRRSAYSSGCPGSQSLKPEPGPCISYRIQAGMMGVGPT